MLVAQSCPILCEPVDCSLPGSSVHGISQTRILESKSCSVVSDSLRPHGLYSPWNSLGQNTGVGSLSLLWGIFPTQGWNPGLLHCRQILYQLSFKGSQKDTYSPPGTETENLKIRPKRATDFHMQPLLEGGYCLSTVKTAVAL